jgi:hypothetical protein
MLLGIAPCFWTVEDFFMIGKVIFQMGETSLEAVLDQDGCWHCRNRRLENYLNTVSAVRSGCTAEEGFGYQSLHHAAALLMGDAIFC